MSSQPAPVDPIKTLKSVFRRDVPISALDHLSAGLVPVQSGHFTFREAIICIDSAGLINLSKHRNAAVVLDYFESRHPTKMVVSAQTLLEFWNSHIASFETISTALSKRFVDLEREIEKIDSSLGTYRDEFKNLIARFNDDYGHLHDAANRAKLVALATQLPGCAEVFEVPRMHFYKYAAYRKSTKTPPGFKDHGDGDYFVWADALFGLLSLKKREVQFSNAVMVTDDKKSDWSKGGVAHPLLSAEVRACVEVPFSCWGVERLISEVQQEVNGDMPPVPDGGETTEADTQQS